MYSISNFSEATFMVLAAAQQEARRLRHTYIATSHFLIGILNSSDTWSPGPGHARDVLEFFGASRVTLFSALAAEPASSEEIAPREPPEKYIDRGFHIFTLPEDYVEPLSMELVSALRSDPREASVEPTDVLFQILQFPDTDASRLLRSVGIEPDRVAHALRQ